MPLARAATHIRTPAMRATSLQRDATRTARVHARSPRRDAARRHHVPAASADDVVREMYAAINVRDVERALRCIDDDIVYEDFNFPDKFVGKAAVRKLFEESCSGIPDEMDFVIDRATTNGPEDTSVGMTWHVELLGEPFPNARGASFYEISPESGKLIYARDVVESPAKLGEASFSIIRVVAPLVKQQIAARQQKAQGEKKSTTNDVVSRGESEASSALTSAAFWLAGAAYWYVLLLSPSDNPIPGDPAYAIKPETLQEVIASSTDFFFVLPVLNKFGINALGEAPYVHPVSLGVFNFAETFIFMLLPLLLMDKRGRDLPTTKMWSIGMFLTNAVLLPYMAIRAATPVESWDPSSNADTEGSSETRLGKKGLMSKAFGLAGLGIGALSVYWTLFEDPAVGGFAERAEYFNMLMHTDRVSVAFVVDIALVCIWQAYFMKKLDKEAGALAYIPYWGLCIWLLL
jgi:hypothetical protein